MTVILKVDPKAVARVKNPLPAPTRCRYCGGNVELIEQRDFYGRNYGNWPYLFLCWKCEARVGLHPRTSIPLGTLANDELRKARQHHKAAFNALLEWSFKGDRSAAYSWLAHRLEIPVESCHWGWFELEQCQRAGELCVERLGVGIE